MFNIVNQEDPAGKIDDLAVNGLEGIEGSLAYKVEKIERHLHSGGRWLTAAGTPTATHFADRIGIGTDPFQLDAGNLAWGSWVQILGSDDTPVIAGNTHYDPHQLIVKDTERAAVYFIQFSQGATGDAGITAGTYAELIYSATVQKETGIIHVQIGRALVGTLMWGRTFCVGQNTGTIDFYIGVHEYEG